MFPFWFRVYEWYGTPTSSKSSLKDFHSWKSRMKTLTFVLVYVRWNDFSTFEFISPTNLVWFGGFFTHRKGRCGFSLDDGCLVDLRVSLSDCLVMPESIVSCSFSSSISGISFCKTVYLFLWGESNSPRAYRFGRW